MMKTRPQMTSVEERMRIPAWRSASPKNLKTRSVKTCATTLPQNFVISPKVASHSLGTASQPTVLVF
jgi:hypothetical protein